MYFTSYPFEGFQHALTTLISPRGALFFRANDASVFVGYGDRSRLSGKESLRVRDVPGIPLGLFKRRTLDFRLVSFDQMIEILRTCPVRADFTSGWTHRQLVDRFRAFWEEGRVEVDVKKPLRFFDGIRPHLVIRANREDGVPMQTWFPEYRKECEKYYADKWAYQKQVKEEEERRRRAAAATEEKGDDDGENRTPNREEWQLLNDYDRWTTTPGGSSLSQQLPVEVDVWNGKKSDSDERLQDDDDDFEKELSIDDRMEMEMVDVVRMKNEYNRWEYFLRLRSKEMINLLTSEKMKSKIRTVRPV